MIMLLDDLEEALREIQKKGNFVPELHKDDDE